MFKIITRISLITVGLLSWFIMPAAAETTVSAEVGFIFNTFLFLVCGFLVTVSYTHLTLPTKA